MTKNKMLLSFLAVIGISISLVACDKGDSGGGKASSPDRECVWDRFQNEYIDQDGRICHEVGTNQVFNRSYCYNYRYDISLSNWWTSQGSSIDCREAYIDFDGLYPFNLIIHGSHKSGCDYWNDRINDNLGDFYPVQIPSVYGGHTMVCAREFVIPQGLIGHYNLYSGYIPYTCSPHQSSSQHQIDLGPLQAYFGVSMGICDNY